MSNNNIKFYRNKQKKGVVEKYKAFFYVLVASDLFQ